MRIRLISLILLFISSCIGKQNNSDPNSESFQIPYPTGDSTNYIQVGNSKRKYLTYRPANLNIPNALFIVLHGGGGQGIEVANPGQHPLSVYRTIADSKGLMLVYPEGSLDVQGRPGWNDCRSDAPSGSSGNDLNFLNELISRLQSELQVPASKTYLVGTSNGAVMTFAYAFNYPNSIKAIAVSSGNLPASPKSGSCTTGPNTSIPIMLSFGTTDPAMPVNGGCVANFGGSCNRGTVISQQDTLDFWIDLNGLSTSTPTQTIIEINSNDQGTAEKYLYSGSHPVVHFKLNGAGHPVPSKTVNTDYSPSSGYQNRDIEFADESWKFFESLN
jgi:polyhydroxybutyrate depolymerase